MIHLNLKVSSGYCLISYWRVSLIYLPSKNSHSWHHSCSLFFIVISILYRPFFLLELDSYCNALFLSPVMLLCCLVHLPCRPWWPSCSSPFDFLVTEPKESPWLLAKELNKDRKEGLWAWKTADCISALLRKPAFKVGPLQHQFCYLLPFSLSALLKSYFITELFESEQPAF